MTGREYPLLVTVAALALSVGRRAGLVPIGAVTHRSGWIAGDQQNVPDNNIARDIFDVQHVRVVRASMRSNEACPRNTHHW